MARWRVHGERVVYDSDWVRLALDEVELPDGRRLDHHVVRTPAPAVGTVVLDGDGPARAVLLLWRHRFITDTYGYEVPAGRVDPGEDLADAAGRECLEETGWAPGPLRALTAYHPINGLSDHTFHLFAAEGATRVGEPVDAYESDRVEWVAWHDVPGLLAGGQVRDGLSLTALLWVAAGLATGPPA